MLDQLLGSVFETEATMAAVSMPEFLLCTMASLILGCVIGLVYMFRNKVSSSFVIAVGLLPVIVQVVILLVNGNIGAGVAVMGVFSLVRFRSMPGTARDITTVFEAMGTGLATGMGYVGLAVLLVAIASVANVAYVLSPLGAREEKKSSSKTLKMLVPEDVDFEEEVEAVLARHCSYELASMETAEMGSVYQLKYKVELNDPKGGKAMIDDLRCVNGNLRISLSVSGQQKKEL